MPDNSAIRERKETAPDGGPSASRPTAQTKTQVEELEGRLDQFDADVRARSLEKLAGLDWPHGHQENVNLHTHTFYSYNAAGWSPSHYAWEARKAGLLAAGIIDFDGVDGIEEFLDAAEALGLRATAGIEIRTFMSDFGTVEIDSPGEPGVHYIAGSGLVRKPKSGTPEAEYLAVLRRTSDRRSRAMVERINAALPAIAVDYDAIVRSRTPGGYATERHFVSAYIDKTAENFPMPEKQAEFWAGLLGQPPDAVLALLQTPASLAEKVRGKLMKKGGIGYEQPGPTSFPPTGEVYAWIKACGAIPMDSWLDGTSAGEARARELLECNRRLGACALNLIPDRNWNVKDPQEKQRKLENLARVIALASEYHMPLHIGTEGNKAGLPFVDDLARPELAPYKNLFVVGAKILVGHAVLTRFADYGYCSAAVEADFAGDTRSRNAFFSAVGGLPPVNTALARRLRDLGPASALDVLRTSSRQGAWTGVGSPS